jgi:hypothetical protein
LSPDLDGSIAYAHTAIYDVAADLSIAARRLRNAVVRGRKVVRCRVKFAFQLFSHLERAPVPRWPSASIGRGGEGGGVVLL